MVGDITTEQMRFVDSFVSEKVSLFMPIAGPCYYALTLRHTHPSYMFCLSFNDALALTMEDGRIAVAEKGKIQALSPDIPHHEPAREIPPRYIAIFIDKNFFEDQYRLYHPSPVCLFQGESYEPVKQLPAYVKEFMIESSNQIPGATVVLGALGLQICHAIIRSVLKIPLTNTTVSERIEINKALEYLYGNSRQKISVGEIAQQVNMSPSHFNRLFKAETGMSPAQYLFDIRMEKAKKLLLAGHKPIVDIAVECGFGSSAYFAERFFKKFKMTPSEYRSIR